MPEKEFACKNYFVDEAGDLAFFDKKKRIIVGNEGCSNFFMVGMAEIPSLEIVEEKLSQLRGELLSDAYFRGVPSMQPEARKTAICFHAKDDLPEVRREVFKLLQTIEAKVIVAVRRKRIMAEQFETAFRKSGQKFNENDIYDDLISRIFKGKLHKADACFVTFARRGKSDRREALFQALEKAKRSFESQWGEKQHPPLTIDSVYPSEIAGLQVIDYYLWAVQRMFEREEDRYFQLLAPRFKLIMDLDDTRNKLYGEWYNERNVCRVEKIKAHLS